MSIDEINNSINEFNVNTEKIDLLFDIITNSGQGNCLFFSLSQIFSEDNSQKDHAKIRKTVCDFYKTFGLDNQYDADSIEQKIQLSLLVDNKHYKKICKGKEWGTLADIYAISLIYKVNIILFSLFKEDPSQYLVIPIKSNENNRTIYLRYNTLNEEEEHYEAMKLKTVNLFNEAIPALASTKTSSSKTSSKRSLSPLLLNKKKKTAKKKPIVHKTVKNNQDKSFRSPEKPDDLIGETVAKVFKEADGQEEYFIGKVVSFNKPYYKVVYDDGDAEDLKLNQLKKIILPKGGKPKKNK